MLAPTTFTRCRPASVPQTGSEKDRNGKALKINYEVLVGRSTISLVGRRHWRAMLRADEVHSARSRGRSREVPQKDERHRSKGDLFSGDPNISRAVRYVELLEPATRCNP